MERCTFPVVNTQDQNSLKDLEQVPDQTREINQGQKPRASPEEPQFDINNLINTQTKTIKIYQTQLHKFFNDLQINAENTEITEDKRLLQTRDIQRRLRLQREIITEAKQILAELKSESEEEESPLSSFSFPGSIFIISSNSFSSKGSISCIPFFSVEFLFRC